MQQYTPYQASSLQNREVPQSPMQVMHTVIHSASPASCSSGSSQVWLTDSGATNHMTVDLANLSLASPYPSTETIHTANGEGLTVSHIGHSTLHSSISPIKLHSVLCCILCFVLLKLLRIYYQYIVFVLIIIVGSYLMLSVFGFRTKPHGGSFTKSCAVMDCILSTLSCLQPPISLIKLQLILVNSFSPPCGIIG